MTALTHITIPATVAQRETLDEIREIVEGDGFGSVYLDVTGGYEDDLTLGVQVDNDGEDVYRFVILRDGTIESHGGDELTVEQALGLDA